MQSLNLVWLCRTGPKFMGEARGGLMVKGVGPRIKWSRFEAWAGLTVLCSWQGTLLSHLLSLHPGVQMGAGKREL